VTSSFFFLLLCFFLSLRVALCYSSSSLRLFSVNFSYERNLFFSLSHSLSGPLTPGFSEWIETAGNIIRKVNQPGAEPEKVAKELHDKLKNLPFCPPIPFLREYESRKVNLNYPTFFPSLVIWGKLYSCAPKLYDFHPLYMLRLWVMTWFGPFKGQIY